MRKNFEIGQKVRFTEGDGTVRIVTIYDKQESQYTDGKFYYAIEEEPMPHEFLPYDYYYAEDRFDFLNESISAGDIVTSVLKEEDGSGKFYVLWAKDHKLIIIDKEGMVYKNRSDKWYEKCGHIDFDKLFYFLD